MCEVAEKEILDEEVTQANDERVFTEQRNKIAAPFSAVIATALYCAELVSSAVLCSIYSSTGDHFWMGFTIAFMLVPSFLTQLALIFIHRDLGRDRPFVLFLHLILLGPIIRCIEALMTYFQAGRKEEPYVTLSRKIKLKGSQATPIEQEIGHSERRLTTHRNAFKRTAVIQAFLGSAPQLTLQLYATIQEKYMIPARVVLITIALLSIIYGALVCSVLVIEIKYNDFKVRLRPLAYLCVVLWRVLEIATRTTALVLFSTALPQWVVPVGLANLLGFFALPWVAFWRKKASLPDSLENNLSKVGTMVALCLVTLLYAYINTFCYSSIQLDLAHKDLVEKHLGWAQLAVYYTWRFVENAALVIMWYFFKSDFYEYICAPLLVVQLLVCYSLAMAFMMVFYQCCHPCRRLFKHNMADCVRCSCCLKDKEPRPSKLTLPPDIISHPEENLV